MPPSASLCSCSSGTVFNRSRGRRVVSASLPPIRMSRTDEASSRGAAPRAHKRAEPRFRCGRTKTRLHLLPPVSPTGRVAAAAASPSPKETRP